MGESQRSKVRECRRHCPVPGRSDGHNVDGQRVARLRAFDVERSGDRIDKRQLAYHRWSVVHCPYQPAETILGVHLQELTRSDVGERLVAAERVTQLLRCWLEGQHLIGHDRPLPLAATRTGGYERVGSSAAPASCADRGAGWLRYSVYASRVRVLCRAEVRAAMPVGCFVELVNLR